MEIIVLEAKATRLTNSCPSSGDRLEIRHNSADSFAADVGADNHH